MEDEKGMDEKLLVVPVHEYDGFNELDKNNIINNDKLFLPVLPKSLLLVPAQIKYITGVAIIYIYIKR